MKIYECLKIASVKTTKVTSYAVGVYKISGNIWLLISDIVAVAVGPKKGLGNETVSPAVLHH